METAAQIVGAARRFRQLTQKELAGISGVTASTISRIESGKVDPAYGTVVTLMRSMGLRPDAGLVEESTDDQIVAAICSRPSLDERFDRYRVAAQVSPVASRMGARTVLADLDDMREVLDRSSVAYAFSALEGFYGGWSASGPQSFWPVVYIEPTFEAAWATQTVPGRPGTVYVLPMTANAARFVETVAGLSVMSPDWSIIDTIASPGRQSDVGLDLLASIDERERMVVA